MIFLIGKAETSSPRFQQGEWDDFKKFVSSLDEVEFDVETVPAPFWIDRKLRTVQFGNIENQWVLQWSALNEEQKAFIKTILENKTFTKIIHNAMFECVIMLFEGIRVQGVFDTMLCEQIRWGGDQTFMSYGLDDVCQRRLGIALDKSQQTAFGDDVLTAEKVIYAAQDVTYLSMLKEEIYQECQQYGLEWVVSLENEAVLAFAEMVYNGMDVDQQWWRNLQYEAEPLVSAAQEKLNSWLHTPEFKAKALQLGYISEQDRVLINWNSPKQKSAIFSELFPELPGTTKAVLKKWQSDTLKNQQSVPSWLPFYIDGDFNELQKVMVTEHRDWLIENQLLIPAGQVTINWNSVTQVLPIIQCVEKVKDLSAESLGRTSHPIVQDLEEFKDTSKLITAFGEEWLNKYVEPDGRVRTDFKQIVSTGRTSSSNPNMQQIPAKESVGNKYRNAFIPPTGWKFVSSDYVSQELIVIAYLSKDPVWQEALSKGQDLHSIAAEMVFADKWKYAADKDCAFYAKKPDGTLAKEKCKCKKHKYMRNGVKTINFGLAYGMSEFKLASTLRIPVPEAKQLIIDYFKAFPGIGKLLDYLGRFGVTKGYIQTIWPFYRKRWFPYWKHYTRYIDEHLMGIQYHGGLGEIERASKNMPIQGTSSDTMKLAAVLIYNYIHDNNLTDKVKMVMQVHDQVDTIAVADYAETWSKKLTELMEDAARFIIPTGILKSDTTITERWSK